MWHRLLLSAKLLLIYKNEDPFIVRIQRTDICGMLAQYNLFLKDCSMTEEEKKEGICEPMNTFHILSIQSLNIY